MTENIVMREMEDKYNFFQNFNLIQFFSLLKQN